MKYLPKFLFGIMFCIGLSLSPIAVWAQVQPVDFGKQILPILRKNCIACHNVKQKEGGLLLESHAGLMQGGDSGAAVPTKKGEEQILLDRVVADDDSVMPPAENKVGAKKLTADEIALIKRWIDEGAKPGTSLPTETIIWQPIPDNVKPIYSVAVSPDGQYAACGRANQVVLYQWPNDKSRTVASSLIDPSLYDPTTKVPPAAHRDVVQSLAFSPDGERLAAGGFRSVKIWRRQTEPTAKRESGGVFSATRDGSLLAMTATDNIIEIYAGPTLQKLFMLRGKYGPIRSLTWSANGAWLFASDLHGQFAGWQIPRGPHDGKTEAGTELRQTFSIRLTEPIDNLAVWGSEFIAGITPTKKLFVARIVEHKEPSAGGSIGYAVEKLNLLAEHVDVVSVRALETQPPRWVLACRDGWIRIANAKSGEVLQQWSHGKPITAMTLSSKSDRVLTSGEDGITKLWNVADGKLVSSVVGDQRSNIELATAQRDLERHKALTERMAARVPELEKVAKAETDAKNKVQESRDKAAQALATKDKEIADALTAISSAEKALADAKKVAEEAAKRVEQVAADLEAKKKAPDTLKKTREEMEAELAKNEQSLAVSTQSAEKAAKAVPEQQTEIERQKNRTSQVAAQVEKLKAQQVVNSVALSALMTPDDNTIVTAHADKSVHISRALDGQPVAVLRGVQAGTGSLACYGNNQLLAKSVDGEVAIWDLTLPWRLERTIGSEDQSLISDRVTAIDFSPDGQLIALGGGPPSRSGELKLFSVADGKLAIEFPDAHSDTILGTRFSPDGQRLLACGADKQVRVFDLATKKLQRTLEGHTHHVLGAAWHDDGETIASASADNTVKIWDVASGEQKRTINVGSKEVSAVSFVGQSAQLISVSADQQARLFDSTNGRSVRSFSGASDALFSVVVTPDSKFIIAGGQDGNLLLWTVDKGELVQKLQ